MTEKLKAILMLEVLGKPPEYLKETIEKIVEEIGKQPEVKMIRKNIADTRPIKDNPTLFTSFAEVEVETSLMRLMSLIFNFMPSHVEIISPETLTIKNFDANAIFSELIRRLHQYDEVAKSILIERQILAEKFRKGELKESDAPLLNTQVNNKKNQKKKRKK